MSPTKFEEGSVAAAAADIVVRVAWDGDPLDVAAVVGDEPNQTELEGGDEQNRTKLEETIVAAVAVAVVVGEGGAAGVALGVLEKLCGQQLLHK